jgi:hypothetical protein
LPIPLPDARAILFDHLAASAALRRFSIAEHYKASHGLTPIQPKASIPVNKVLVAIIAAPPGNRRA